MKLFQNKNERPMSIEKNEEKKVFLQLLQTIPHLSDSTTNFKTSMTGGFV